MKKKDLIVDENGKKYMLISDPEYSCTIKEYDQNEDSSFNAGNEYEFEVIDSEFNVFRADFVISEADTTEIEDIDYCTIQFGSGNCIGARK